MEQPPEAAFEWGGGITFDLFFQFWHVSALNGWMSPARRTTILVICSCAIPAPSEGPAKIVAKILMQPNLTHRTASASKIGKQTCEQAACAPHVTERLQNHPRSRHLRACLSINP